MSLYLEFDAVVRAFADADLRYAVAGGLAVGLHGYLRTTEDMDFLVHPDCIVSASELLAGLGYSLRNEPWTFTNTRLTLHRFMKPVDRTEDIHIVDLLTPEEQETLNFIERAEEIPFADTRVRVVQAKDLITMKRARGSAVDDLDIQMLERRDEKRSTDDES